MRFRQLYDPKRETARIATISGFPRYSVTDDGRVISFVGKKPIQRKLQLAGSGNQVTVHLMTGEFTGDDNRLVSCFVSRLVAAAFVPNPHPKQWTFVHHKDWDNQNNHYTNLEWCTFQYINARLTAEGQRGTYRLFTDAQVRAIRREYAKNSHKHGYRTRLAEQYGVHKDNIYQLLRGETYRNVV